MDHREKIDGPRIITSSWYTVLPPDVARVSISRGPPRGQRDYKWLTFLAPGRWFRAVDELEYVERYTAQLGNLDPGYVHRRLIGCARHAPTVALLCFEQPGVEGSWCHRSLTAAWLSNALGLPVPEFGFEHLPQDQHPLLPPSMRQRGA